MKALRIENIGVPFWWTAWELPDEWQSGQAHRRARTWVMKKPSRSASVWRLADDRKTRWFIIAVSEHRLVCEALEKRIAKEQGAKWYELPEEDLIALVRRRAADALRALESGQERDLRSERHFGGRWKLNPDGTLEPMDRNQG